MVLVKKKDGTVQFCTDYRRLNLLTKDEAAPLPRIQKVLRDFGTASMYSSLDLKSGYWQIPMDQASKRRNMV
jgi:ligand-binding sensor domain-containing protein